MEITAPEEETIMTLAAGVGYVLDEEFVYDEVDWIEYFDVQVIEDDGNWGGIPGFPIETLIFGVLIGFFLTSRRTSLDLGLSTQ